jgi:uncharacterized protein with FMN-binding domain
MIANAIRCLHGSVSAHPLVVGFLLALLPASAATGDVMELLSGAKLEGKVTKIDKAAKEVTFETRLSGRPYTRAYPYSRVHAVTLGDKRYVLTEKPDSPPAGTSSRSDGSKPAASPSPRSPAGSAPTAASGDRRTRAELEQWIDQQGSTPPDWYDATPLKYPPSLDLNWPEPAPGPWNNQKNIGQFIWDVVNPNPSRWREGVRLLHHLLTLHQDKPPLRTRIMKGLAGMYFRFFQDYERAAFWWHKAGIGMQDGEAIQLAECYWRLGNQPMAMEILNQRMLRIGMIKLLADMGETDKALQVAATWVKVGGEPHPAYLAAGDACRLAGRFQEAIAYYQKVLGTPPMTKREKAAENFKNRARASLDAVRLFELCDVTKVPDGVYTASSIGYAGDIVVEVSVNGGRIEAVQVKRHEEKQFYSALTDTPRQIIQKRGVQGVDAVSGATITSEAILNATAKALANAVK